MSSTPSAAIDWDHLTDNHAAILEAYFALRSKQRRRKVVAVRAAQTRLTREETLKHARPAGGAEREGKWLHLLGHNAPTLALLRSAEPEVRAMDAATVFELLLDRPALTCIEEGRMTMWLACSNSCT